jgi:hypothetical protein
MIAKCPCQQCQTNIEFEIEHAGEFVQCPNCNQQTRLLLSIPSKQPKNSAIQSNLLIKAAWIVGSIFLVFVGYAFSTISNFETGETAACIGFFSIPLYFVPTVVGWGKKNCVAIFILNAVLGWTFLGWLGALIWAASKD